MPHPADPSAPAITRRQALAAAGAAGAAGAVAAADPAAAAGRRRRPARPRRRARPFDVVVVGAGLAGLTAARAVRRAGARLLVVEATDRVGGRVLDVPLGGGAVAEMGGQWTGPGQDAVQALAREAGVETFETYRLGRSTWTVDGRVERYEGFLPPIEPVALAELLASFEQMDGLAGGVDPARPWEAARAGELDGQTAWTWIERTCLRAQARGVWRLIVEGVYGEEPEQLSLLDLVAAVAGGGGDIGALIEDAQTVRFAGGPQQLATFLAGQVGRRAIRLRSPVLALRRARAGWELQVGGGTVHARTVVLTPARTALARLLFEPALPPGPAQVLQRQPQGSVVKLNAVYDEPFWRSDGLNGQVFALDGPVTPVYDNSPPGGRPGVLVAFLEANHGRRLFTAGPGTRRGVVLEALTRYFGPRAARPRALHEQLWAAEPFVGGAYGTFSPPGAITALGPQAAIELPGVAIAGDATSAEWPGYMDGAIRSGQRAAREVLAAL